MPQSTSDGPCKGRLAVVTGAASGIGKATTRALLATGCSVVATDIDTRALEILAVEYGASDGHIITLGTDVASWQQVQNLARDVLEAHGVPDYLVANAGINPPAPSTGDVDEAFWDRIMDVNLKGIFACCRMFLPAMADAGRGSVVNLASVSGLIGWGGTSVYSASKGGVIALTRYLAAEYAPKGVRVNCVCPGSIRTPMVMNNVREFADSEERLARTASLHPLNRIGEAREVADAILYLLSDRASFVTGAAFTVDGGFTAV
jgi:NAD(P)-dependent dehydrogenase (short-subunit alcohol dehydrogenase family)